MQWNYAIVTASLNMQILWVTWYNVGSSANEMGNPENMGVAVEILFLCHPEAKICFFTFRRRPSWILPFPVSWYNIGSSPNEFGRPKNIRIVVGISFICHPKADIWFFTVIRRPFWILRLPVTWYNVSSSANEMGSPENMGVAVEIFFLSHP